jgi:hypothetical protein
MIRATTAFVKYRPYRPFGHPPALFPSLGRLARERDARGRYCGLAANTPPEAVNRLFAALSAFDANGVGFPTAGEPRPTASPKTGHRRP